MPESKSWPMKKTMVLASPKLKKTSLVKGYPVKCHDCQCDLIVGEPTYLEANRRAEKTGCPVHYVCDQCLKEYDTDSLVVATAGHGKRIESQFENN